MPATHKQEPLAFVVSHRQLADAVECRIAALSPRLLLATGVAVLASTVPALLAAPEAAHTAIDTVQQILVSTLAVVALLSAGARADREGRRVARGLAAVFALAAAGMVVWYFDSSGVGAGAGAGNALFLVAVAALVVTLTRSVFGALPRPRLSRVALDTAMLLFANATIVALLWHRTVGSGGLGADEVVNIVVGTLTIAGPVAVCLTLIDRGVRPALFGPYAVLAGIAIVGVDLFCWQTLSAGAARGSAVWGVDAGNIVYSVGVLVASAGGVGWDLRASSGRWSRRLMQAAGDLFPLLAVGTSVFLLLTAPNEAIDEEIVRYGTGSVVVLALTRQMLLTVQERRARLAALVASGQLSREIRTREVVLRSLGKHETAESPEAMARAICEQALAFEGVDSAAIVVFEQEGDAVVLGGSHLEDLPPGMRGTMPPNRSSELLLRASAGPWTETSRPESVRDQHGSLFGHDVRNVALAPIVWNERLLGVIGMATLEEAAAEIVAERQATAGEFGIVAGALLGPALEERDRRDAVRQSVSDTIGRVAFHPVFQPIVDLASGRTVGFEALTRFADGRRPDLWFGEAASVGMGIELEVACLRLAVEDAASLPPATYVSVNASPELATALVPLLAALEGADRGVVVEITEQARVGSYVGLREALDTLRGHMRIAVDDAGAGYAGLQQILELRPHIVKLDISLVRGVNEDAARRALIGSMVTFAAETGSTLLAEGIETEAELATLRALGVTLGQGYLLGRPARVGEVAEAASSAPDTGVAA